MECFFQRQKILWGQWFTLGLKMKHPDNSWCLVSVGKLFSSNFISRQSSYDTEWVSPVYLSHFPFCCKTVSYNRPFSRFVFLYIHGNKVNDVY